MSATLHTLRRVGKPLWGPRTGTTWFWIEGFIGTQPLADVLRWSGWHSAVLYLPVFLLQQQRWVLQQRQHTKPTIFPIWIFAKKKSLLTPNLKRQKSTQHCDGRTMQTSQGRKAGLWVGKGGAQRGCREEGVGEVGVQRGRRGGIERDAGQQDHLRGRSGLRRQHIPSWNHFQKFTDLSGNPGMYQTASETPVRFCMPGWSRVLGEKMLSGKTPGSELGKQRQIHDRESQGGWMWGNQLPPGLCGHMSC